MEIKLSVAKIVTGVVTTLIIGAILGSFTLVRTSDSLVYRVLAIELDNAELKKHIVPRSEFETTVRKQTQRLERMEKQLDRIESKL